MSVCRSMNGNCQGTMWHAGSWKLSGLGVVAEVPRCRGAKDKIR